MRIPPVFVLSTLLVCAAWVPLAGAGDRPAVRSGATGNELQKKDDTKLQREQAPSTLGRQPLTRNQAPKRGLQALPAQEVVELSCPTKLVYYALELEQSPALHGWQTQTVTPKTPRMTLRFSGIEGLNAYSWKGASEIVCKYFGEGQEGDDSNYSTRLKRKIHPSGTPYSCKLDDDYGPDVECRLSITPF